MKKGNSQPCLFLEENILPKEQWGTTYNDVFNSLSRIPTELQ